jgi:hypothetical protein
MFVRAPPSLQVDFVLYFPIMVFFPAEEEGDAEYSKEWWKILQSVVEIPPRCGVSSHMRR